MSTYRGPATLVAGDYEIDVETELSASRAGEERQWGGRVQTSGVPEPFAAAMEGGDVTLRFPDGEERAVLATHTAIGSGLLRVTGTGTVPF
jgi:uncharacterized protein DUF4873